MTSAPYRLSAAWATILLVTGGIALPASAVAAPVATSTHCVSKATFFRAIPNKQRAYILHHNHPSQAVHGLRCTPHWDVALVTASDGHGHGEYSFEVLEHKVGSRWHVYDRAKACGRHVVPRSLYQEVCQAD